MVGIGIKQSTVRIWKKKKNEPKGAGFLISDREILTCAHVVEGLGEDIQLDFPLLDKKPRHKARVKKIIPKNPQAGIGDFDDIAVLELAEDEVLEQELHPAKIYEVDLNEIYDREVAVYGFPEDINAGEHVDGRLKFLIDKGWIQINRVKGSRSITKGFSGAAVWDKKGHGVVGMVVTAKTDDQDEDKVIHAYMIPADVLKKAEPLIESIIRKIAGTKEHTGRLVCKLCNRDQQYRKFNKCFEENYNLKPKRAQVYVIEGCEGGCHESGCHESLIFRLRIKCVRKLIQQKTNQTKDPIQYNVPLSSEGDFESRKDDLREKIADRLHMSDDDQNTSLMEQLKLSGLDQAPAILFTHYIDAFKWDKEYEQLITWYIHTYLNYTDSDETLPQILIFFMVLYPKPGHLQRIFRANHRLKKKIINRMDTILKTSKTESRYAKIKELDEVKRQDVRNWFIDNCHWIDSPERDKKISGIFKGREQLCMKDVELKLKEIINSRTSII